MTQPGIAMALRQSGSAGRHRRKSHAAGWTMPREHTESYAATGRTTPRHRKTSQVADTTGPRHRKTPQAAGSRSTPRHRKKGRGNIQAIYPSLHIGQDNSIRLATRRAALPGALAVGLLAVGGVITGAFSTPLPGIDRADGTGSGGMASASIPPPPALTAMSTPSPALPARADRGVRGPVDASAPAAWPISEQAGAAGVSGDGGAGQPAQSGTTTIVRDRAAEPGVFAPTVTADPPSGHGGGGPAESSMQPDPPAAGGGPLSGVFSPGGLLNDLAGGPSDSGSQEVDPRGDAGAAGNANPRADGPDRPGRADRPGARRTDSPGDAGGAGRGLRRPGKTSDGGSGNRGNGGQTGGGGQHRGEGSHR
jgi:hypothetical protein